MTYVSVNEQLYPATITGVLRDMNWNDRPSKEITLEMPYEQALELFVDDIQWSIVEIHEYDEFSLDEEGNEVVTPREDRIDYDNSEYSIAGDITNHRNGTVSVKMGKPTAEELLALIEEAL